MTHYVQEPPDPQLELLDRIASALEQLVVLLDPAAEEEAVIRVKQQGSWIMREDRP